MPGSEFKENMLESTAADNLAFDAKEEKLRYEMGQNGNFDHVGDKTTSSVQTSQSALNQIDHGCVSKIISFVDGKAEGTAGIKVYKKRFWMLALYGVCSMLNAMQWLQYTVVSDVTMCFYGVDFSGVNWSANLYLIIYAPLVIPVSWFTERMGIRYTLLIGSFLTCVGTAIQCGCTTPETFTYVLVSQALSAAGQVFVLALPPYISATWFGANELSRASAVGVFGNQLGSALGFIFTPLIVSEDCANKPEIAHGKQIVAYTLVTCNLVVFVLILATFQEKPKKPPSIAEVKKVEDEKDYKRSLCALLKNPNYDLLLLTYGIIVGVYFAVSTILNSLVSAHFTGKDTEIGWMGLTAILFGTVGSIIAGYILDWSHRYKETSIGIFALSFASMILFAALLYVNLLWLQFVTIAILGFFITSYLPVGFEFAVEITYPESESLSAQLLNTSTMVLGLVFTVIGANLMENYSDVAANIFFCTVLLLGTIITALIKCDFRRQNLKNKSVAVAVSNNI